MEYAPEKINGPTKPTMGKRIGKVEFMLDQAEVNRLINASDTPVVVTVQEDPDLWYNTYQSEEVNALIAGIYDPSHFKHLK